MGMRTLQRTTLSSFTSQGKTCSYKKLLLEEKVTPTLPTTCFVRYPIARGIRRSSLMIDTVLDQGSQRYTRQRKIIVQRSSLLTHHLIYDIIETQYRYISR